jgi:hypothetical protein
LITRTLISSALLFSLATACAVAPKNDVIPTAPKGLAPVQETEHRSGKLFPIPGAPPMTPEERETAERRFRIAALETAQPSVAVSNDVDQDTEPTVTALNIGGTDYTTVGFIKITATATPFRARIYTSSTSNLSSFPTPTAPALPASGLAGITYLNSADPYLAANIHNSGPGPLRKYLVGLAYNMNTNGSHPNGGVVVWRSDNGGSTWSGSTIVAETASPRTIDKPHIAVSWNTASYDGHGPTVGNVYAVWCDVPSSGTTDLRIMFSRSTDGGVTWSTPQTLATGFVHAPQVVVPANTGRVFVLYARYTSGATRNNSIEMVRSLDAGVTFSSQPTLSSTRMFGPFSDMINGSPNQVQARTVFQARYNPSVGIQVVWHGEDPNNTAQADIYYASYGGTWTTTNLTPSAAGDQWNPSFDYDTSRNAVITWLDRRNDPSNLLYQPYYMKINTSGGTMQAASALDSSTSDPGQYQMSRSVGEYADTWYWTYTGGSKWITVWPSISGVNNGNIRATQITP